MNALASVQDGALRPEGVGLATIDAESERFLQLTDEEIEEYLVAEDILAEETEE